MLPLQEINIMENFFMNFEIKPETIVPFIGLLESYERTIPEGNEGRVIARIYVESPGGEVQYTEALYHFLKNSKYEYEFVVLSAYSCALMLLIALNPRNLVIHQGSSGLTHLIGLNVSTRDTKADNRFFVAKRLEHLEESNNQIIDVFKHLLTKEELLLHKQGEDVYLSSTRLLGIFEKINSTKTIKDKVKKIFEKPN